MGVHFLLCLPFVFAGLPSRGPIQACTEYRDYHHCDMFNYCRSIAPVPGKEAVSAPNDLVERRLQALSHPNLPEKLQKTFGPGSYPGLEAYLNR